MHVSLYTPYPSGKEFSWHHSCEWVVYFHLEAFHSTTPAILWNSYRFTHWSSSNSWVLTLLTTLWT